MQYLHRSSVVEKMVVSVTVTALAPWLLGCQQEQTEAVFLVVCDPSMNEL